MAKKQQKGKSMKKHIKEHLLVLAQCLEDEPDNQYFQGAYDAFDEMLTLIDEEDTSTSSSSPSTTCSPEASTGE